MSIDAALLIARSGLQYTQRALSNAANNVANAETEGYTRKKIVSLAVSADAQPMGVRILGPSRDVDNAILGEINKRRSATAAAELRSTVLAAIDAAHGQVDEGTSLGDLMFKLKDSFVQLRLEPSQVVKQQAVVLLAAQNLTDRFVDLSGVISEERQQAQDGIHSEIGAINASLRELASLTNSIIARIGAQQSAADLEDQRDLALNHLSQSVAFKAVRQENGGLILLGAGGITFPLAVDGDAFAVQRSTVSPQSYYGAGGSIPPITLLGVDVTQQMVGGRLGEYLTLRDQTLPRYLAELDIAAVEVADRFRSEGLKLFADAGGNLPDSNVAYAGSDQIGFAGRMQVNAAVRADTRLLRDGTETLVGPPVSFTPNPIDGPAGFTDLIDRILTYSFGEFQAPGVSWGGFATSGLGPDGSLSSPFGAPKTIDEYAIWLTGTQTGDSAAATKAFAVAKEFSDGVEARFSRQSGVDVDSEMAFLIQLQNAYSANARVLSTAQNMWETLVGAVR